MNTKKWRQFLIEGDAQVLADQLENELGVKVKPDSNNESGEVTIYPTKAPGDQVYSSDRMAQRINVKYDGGLKLKSIVGYERSMELIGEPYTKTSMANQGMWMPEYGGGLPIGMDALKIYVLQLKRGLEGEAKAQSDFYKKDKGYYKQDGRIGVGLSSQPRMK